MLKYTMYVSMTLNVAIVIVLNSMLNIVHYSMMNVSITFLPHDCINNRSFKNKNSYYTFLCKLCQKHLPLFHCGIQLLYTARSLLKCYASAIYINSETAHNKHAVYYRSSTNSGMLVQK